MSKRRRKKKSVRPGPTPPSRKRTGELTFLPQVVAAFCLLLAGICYVAFSLIEPHRRAEPTAGQVGEFLNRAPYILSVMFLWFGLVGMLWQGYVVGKWLRRPSNADPPALILLAGTLPPVLLALLAGMAAASVWTVLIALAATTLITTLLSVRLKGRSLLEGLLLGLVPLLGLMVEAFLPARPDTPAAGRPPPSR